MPAVEGVGEGCGGGRHAAWGCVCQCVCLSVCVRAHVYVISHRIITCVSSSSALEKPHLALCPLVGRGTELSVLRETWRRAGGHTTSGEKLRAQVLWSPRNCGWKNPSSLLPPGGCPPRVDELVGRTSLGIQAWLRQCPGSAVLSLGLQSVPLALPVCRHAPCPPSALKSNS